MYAHKCGCIHAYLYVGLVSSCEDAFEQVCECTCVSCVGVCMCVFEHVHSGVCAHVCSWQGFPAEEGTQVEWRY